MKLLYFISHPEVEIDPNQDIREWGLSEKGKSRLQKMLILPWVKSVKEIYSSTERKALETAQIMADFLHQNVEQLKDLGEMDRSSTGYLPFAEFNKLADEFFRKPDESIKGWESATDAQKRTVGALNKIMSQAKGNVAVCSHGGVGALALSAYLGQKIARETDQPGDGGGNYFVIDMETKKVVNGWKKID